MIIKNINAIEMLDCKCENWLDHWLKFSEQEPTYCPVAECMNVIQTAAHVQRDDPKDSKWYIFPVCHKHDAMIGESLTVNDHIDLVSADVRETCRKMKRV